MNGSQTICRGYSELPVPSGLTLQQCAERGRLLSDDYVFDGAVENWVCARDLEELKRFFQRRRAGRVSRGAGVLAVSGIVSFFGAPLLAGILIITAAIFAAWARALTAR